MSSRKEVLQVKQLWRRKRYCTRNHPRFLNWHAGMLALDLPLSLEKRQWFCKPSRLFWENIQTCFPVLDVYRIFLSKMSILFQFCGLANNGKSLGSYFPTILFPSFHHQDSPFSRDLFQLSWKTNFVYLIISKYLSVWNTWSQKTTCETSL